MCNPDMIPRTANKVARKVIDVCHKQKKVSPLYVYSWDLVDLNRCHLKSVLPCTLQTAIKSILLTRNIVLITQLEPLQIKCGF